ncbi:MAG TPA: cytochrome c3 family protein, partial [Nitrospiria bacterium]|nr:cytochrome c3 family protein [Nitrospiria bacterium]
MRHQGRHLRLLLSIAALAAVVTWSQTGLTQPPPPPPPVSQQVLEDITNTKHNLSSIDPAQLLSSGVFPRPGSARDAKAAPGGTTEICVFCHTPHGASATGGGFKAPIWNRSVDYQASQTYQLYDQVWSFSFEGTLNDAAGRRPTGYSRLCLSCHDGTVALGNLLNAPGSGGYQGRVAMTGNLGAGGTIPHGSGDLTGDTRRLGLDLRNDHPISFAFDQALLLQDQELVNPGPALSPPSKVGDPTPISPARRYPGNDPNSYDSVQCTSCHNPHQVNYPKFLRANWFHKETNNPDPGKNHPTEQIICLFCHDKPRWIDSTHAVSNAVRSQYPLVNNDPSNVNSGYDYDGSHTVSELACRNCHDLHTIQGAKRLHREGVNAQGTDGIEATCYLCHAPNSTPTAVGTLVAGDPTSGANPRFVTGTGRPAPDVYSEFSKDIGVGNCATFPKCGSAMNLQFNQGHEPVFTARSQEGVELDSPSPPANNETSPGVSTPDVAHIECVDCHNPHQVVRGNRLRGMKGITIDDQVIETSPADLNRPYVYEVCFRCHGNSYTNIFNGDRFPDDTVYRSNPLMAVTNAKFSLAGFSNKRLEFATYGSAGQERTGGPDQSYVIGQPWGTVPLRDSSGAQIGTQQAFVGPGVHKAFHPVAAGGRNGTTALKNQLAFWAGGREPRDITIQCTDCHNSDYYNAYGNSGSPTITQDRFKGPITESNAVRPGDVPNLGISQDYDGERSQHPIGPHGSNNIRILRAPYNTDIANPNRSFRNNGFNAPIFPGFPGQTSHWDNFLLCFQCHDRTAFDPNVPGADPANGSPSTRVTNFFGVPASPSDGSSGTNPPAGLLSWESNLHMYHLQRTGAMCHECHYNVHSNVQAQNTIFGDGTGCIGGTPQCPAGLPPDAEDGITDGVSDTHLINFAPPGPTIYSGERKCDDARVSSTDDMPCTTAGFTPTQLANPNPQFTSSPDSGQQQNADIAKANVFEGVEGVTADRPVWYYTETDFSDDGTPATYGVFRCNLRCHGVVMSTCFYMGNANRNLDKNMNTNGTAASDTWCAGGRQQIAPDTLGAAPP